MKTSTSIYIAIAFCLIGFSTTAQTNKTIQIGQVKVNSAKQELNDVTITKVMLSWNVNVGESIENVEVERSFDLVNFHFAGNISSINPLNERSNSFCFEDNSAILAQQPIAQYRIKYTDANGIVQYSEAKLVGLKS